MADLKVGDVVQLKSGGPEMTVESIGKSMEGRPVMFCAWFAGPDKKTSSFPAEALDKNS